MKREMLRYNAYIIKEKVNKYVYTTNSGYQKMAGDEKRLTLMIRYEHKTDPIIIYQQDLMPECLFIINFTRVPELTF